MSTFKECAACAAKPGTPHLCESCLHNRSMILDMEMKLEEAECQPKSDDLVHETTIKHKFKPGDGVTFAKMLKAKSQGPPCRLAVVEMQTNGGAVREPLISYWCRILFSAGDDTDTQRFTRSHVRNLFGLEPIPESELVAYETKEKPDDPQTD